MSGALAEKVREVALRLGYIANQHARTLAGGTSSTVGLLVHEIGDPYFSEIAGGVIDTAESMGMTVQICHTGRSPETELHHLRTFIANRVGTIIIAGSGHVDSSQQLAARHELESYVASGGRVAAIGRHHLGVDAIRPDNVAGGETIARHLVDLGHRKIAIAAGSTGLSTVADRIVGITHVLAEYGIAQDDRPIVEVEFTDSGGRLATQQILEQHPHVTAIAALNDAMAIGVLSELRARGISVPNEMSVAGFDDVAVASSLAPSLTTIRLPMSEMGRRALELAVSEPAARVRQRKTSHELVARDSTSTPRPN